MSSILLSRRYSLGRTAALLVPGGILALLSVTVAGVMIPSMRAEFPAAGGAVPWVTTVYLLVSATAIPVGGWAGTRFGVRRTWLIALAVFAAGALASAVAPDVTLLIAARALQAAGGGVLEPLMLTALARAAGPTRMGRVMGGVAAAMSIGPLAGPALAAAVVTVAGWRTVFLVIAAVAAVLLACAALWLPAGADAEGDGARRLDGVGLLLLSAGAVGILVALGQSVLWAGIVGVAGLGGAIAWMRRHGDDALIPPRTFRQRGFGPAVVIMVGLGAAIFPLFFAVPQYLGAAVGVPVVAAGSLLIPYGIGTVIAMPVVGALSDRIAARRLVTVGAVVAALGFVGLVVAPSLPVSPVARGALLVGSLLLVGLGLGAVGSPTVATLYRVLPPDLLGTGSTVLFVGNQLGGAAGVAVVAALIGSDGWTVADGAVPLLLPLAAVALIAVLAQRLPAPTPA
ncbi:MFS transporter [Leifsonia sp. WHRI 6310E]|uniref:MFS transporter n=1 Tax=Leifsonia sp. WHRI 6310E TaxID=3162562 RepID=UPI0032EE2A16